MASSEFQQAIREQRNMRDLATVLARFGQYELVTAADALAVAEIASRWSTFLPVDPKATSPLSAILGFFQQVESQEAFETLAEHGLPHVRSLFDALHTQPASAQRTEDLLFATKILVLYHDPVDLPRIAATARDESLDHESLWSVIFQSVGEGYPLQRELVESLRAPLPVGGAALAYLDFVNAVALEDTFSHPFDTAIGHELLASWLGDFDAGPQSKARSAASALPFLSATPDRQTLVELGLRHPLVFVQLQASYAAAQAGDRSAVERLSQACLDPKTSAMAITFLENLGELNAIPVRAKNPDFMAISEMCRWLAHPMEFGRPPDEVWLYDSRTLQWPPANEPRNFWLVRYLFRGVRPDGSDESGIGLVGSITFTLYDEVSPSMPAEDVYALHCCWELEVENDPRTPQPRSIAAGRELLRRAGNPGF